MNRNKVSRRDVLKTGGAASIAIGAPYFVPAAVLGAGDATPPSDQIALGHIGLGVRGRFLWERSKQVAGVRSVAFADCYVDRRETPAAESGGVAYDDFRSLLDRDDVDAVIVATPDHWHVPIALMAAQSGKDAYVEKPLGLTLEQDLRCEQVFGKLHRILQYGTQQREAAHQQYGRELIRSGKLGRLKAIEVKAPNGGTGGSTEAAAIPNGFDYDMWLGPAPEAPYTPDRCKPPGSYWIYDQSIGYVAGWGAHPLDILVWCYDGDQAGPFTVEGDGVIPAAGLYNSLYDWDMTLRMADHVKITIRTGSDSTKFIGADGRVELTRSSIRAFPTDLIGDEQPANNHAENAARHIHNFANSIRTRQPPSSPVEDAVRSDVISQLCDISVRSGERLTWDPAERRIVSGSERALSMTSRPLRAPWTL